MASTDTYILSTLNDLSMKYGLQRADGFFLANLPSYVIYGLNTYIHIVHTKRFIHKLRLTAYGSVINAFLKSLGVIDTYF